MSGWEWVVALNVVTAASYLGIAYFIVRGLITTRQLARNRLAVATAFIFLTCAAHHLMHGLDLVGAPGMHMDLMRELMGDSIDVAVTASTAITGVVYLGLRRSYGMLLHSPAMFDHAGEARYRQLAANLPHTSIFVFDKELRYVLAGGAGLDTSGYEHTALEGKLVSEVVPPAEWTNSERHYRAAIKGDFAEFDRPSDVGAVFHNRIGPLRDEAGSIIGGLVIAEDVTAEHRMRERLLDAQAFNAAVLTASPDITVISSMQTGEMTWASRSVLQLIGWPPADDLTDEGPLLAQLVLDEDKDRLVRANESIAQLPDGESVTCRFRLDAPEGYRWIARQSTPFRRSSDGEVVSYLSVVQDVTADVEVERHLQEKLQHAEAFNAAVLTASPDITVVSAVGTGQTTWASRSVLGMLGLPPGEDAADEDATFLKLIAKKDRQALLRINTAIAQLPDGESITFRLRVRATEGYRWLTRLSTPFRRDDDGNVLSFLSVLRDVTDVVDVERRMQHAALHDPLTGLPNRALLMDRMTSALARAERLGVQVAILFCDLDGFKKVNDMHGHATGDAVLGQVAQRLEHLIRKSDSVARVGGDEFVVILEPSSIPTPGPPAEADVAAGDPRDGVLRQVSTSVANRIRAELSRPFEVGGERHCISVSVGMTFARSPSTAQDVLRDADLALYRAKQRGKNRVEVFDESLGADVMERNRVETVLRESLDAERTGPSALTVAYQPVYDLVDHSLVGFEALARLVDPTGRVIPPDAFIPIAEETGMITQLGESVLDQAMACLVEWRATHPDDRPATMAVNLSARQAQHAYMPQVVTNALARHGLEPSGLILELTESVLLESGSSTLRQLTELRRAGVGIAIDDFGTGYASLRYLATLPVSSVKVDRSFTNTLTTSATSATIVHAILNLARDLGLDCVVEGIETREQLESLPYPVFGQGFLLGRPTAHPLSSWRGGL